jgi:hypothetical protein
LIFLGDSVRLNITINQNIIDDTDMQEQGEHMQKLLLIAALVLFSFKAQSEISGSVGVDFKKNTTTDNIYATKDVDIDISSDVGFASVALITNTNDQVILDEYALGVKSEMGSLSYGDQGDIFIGGGLEVVGADTLANPSDDGESIMATWKNTSARFKFTDSSSDVTDFATLQLKHSIDVGVMNWSGSVDHTIETDNNIFALQGQLPVGTFDVTGVATHDDTLTNEIAYETIVAKNGFSVFVNGDESDWSKNTGAGYKATWKSLDWYIEAGYNLDSEDVTPAAGMSVKF